MTADLWHPDGVIQVEREDLQALVDAGYVADKGNDVYEVTDEGREYIRRLKEGSIKEAP